MEVKTGHNVQVHYKGTFSDGTIFDESRARGTTLSFTVGSGKMIPGFDTAVVGMTEGQVKNITIAPDQGYGDTNPEAFQNVPKEQFGDDFDFVVDGMIKGNGPRGPFVARIHEVQDENVILDFNHPLAGKEINFEIELVAVADSTTDTANTETE
tara:strand:+ start:212 stop:673 length:462 start_codon:yes stop_codon:yes gene_type:complete